MIERVNSRVSTLNAWIKDAVVDGKRVFYDRASVLSKVYTDISFNEEGARVVIPHRDRIREQFKSQESNEPVGGTCRELAQWAAVKLVNEGIVDESEVYACATEAEAHYVVIVELDGEKYLVDIAYSQPVLEAIAVDGNEYKSKVYSGLKGTKQSFSGDVSYMAEENEEGVILFKVDSDSRSTEFPLRPLTDELDAQIPQKWVKVTGSAYSTRVRKNEDGLTYRVDMEDLGGGSELRDELKRVHEMAKKFGSQAIEVLFER